MDQTINELRSKIVEKGFDQEDKRLNRKTRSLPGDFTVIPKELLDGLKALKPGEKFKPDWTRMYPSFRLAVKAALEDLNSRRLLVSNMSQFTKVWPCFTHVQFVYTHRNEFDLYVYMRSSDLEKFPDDCIFFASLAKRFEKDVKVPVTKLVVVFGHVHFQIGGASVGGSTGPTGETPHGVGSTGPEPEATPAPSAPAADEGDQA